MKLKRIILTFGLLTGSYLLHPALAQCKFFGAKMCDRYLTEDYRSNGQSNTAAMTPGETATLQMVFYKGHDYRLVFCSEEHLGQLGIKVKSATGEVLFNNAEHDMSFHWDFSMQKTQRFIIEVSAPDGDPNQAMEGCVAISTGVRPSIAKGFNKGQ